MTKATSNRTGIHYVAESTIGTTPATPALIEVRYTGEGINFDVETAVSDEIRSDRQVTDLVPVSQTSSGNLDFELSFAEFDPFFEAALFSDYSSAIGVDAEVTISTDADGILDSANGLGNIVAGQWIKVTGFVTNSGENNGVYRVLTAAVGEVTVSPAPASVEAATPAVTITGQMLRNGTTQKSFTIQKRFNDATAIEYNNFTGMQVNGLSLSFETGAILGGSMDFLGYSGALTSTQISGATNVGATTNDVMNSVSNLQNIEIDDTDTTASILSMTVDVANNLRTQNAIGSLAAVGIGVGKFEVTGSISVYFEDNTEYAKYTGNTAFKLSMRAEDNAGKAYVFTFPRVKYESMTLAAGGSDSDIVLEGSWRALRDSTLDNMMQIDRLSLINTDFVA